MGKLLAFAVAALLAAQNVVAQDWWNCCNGFHMGGWGWMWPGFGLFWVSVWLAFWVLVIWLIVWLVRRTSLRNDEYPELRRMRDRGEITQREYERRIRVLRRPRE